MNDFDKAREVERIARDEVLPWLVRNSDGIRETDDPGLFQQKVWGDWLIWKQGKLLSIEFKAETSNAHGNLFLETWSNRSMQTPGWMVTCRADFLYYYFIEQRHLFTLDFAALRAWAWGAGREDGKIYRYPEKPQGKYEEQKNDTWGRVVPVAVLLKIPEIRMRWYVPGDMPGFFRQKAGEVLPPAVPPIAPPVVPDAAGLKGTLQEPWGGQF